MGMLDSLFQRDQRSGRHVSRSRGRRSEPRPALGGALAAQNFQLRAGFEPLEGRAMLAAFSFDGTAYLQNFDALGVANSIVTDRNLANVNAELAGWFFNESGTGANAQITAGTGSSNSGDTYNFGAAGGSDRALGGLLSGSLTPSFGFGFTNTSGQSISTVAIAYTGETWRIGATGRSDRLDFQYSLDATSLTTGTWTDVNSLDYANPSASATASGSVLHTAAISGQIGGLTLAANSTMFLRWTDFNATGPDDGMAIDDFSLSIPAVATPLITAPPSVDVMSAIVNTPSARQSFAVSGVNLTASITATAPTGFEVSSDGTTYAATATLPQAAGSATGAVYVRIAASNTTPGPLSGNVVLSSDGATAVNVAVSGTVRPASIAVPYSENFEASQGDWFAFNAAGSRNWTYVTTSLGLTGGATTKAWEMNGFGSDVLANDWLLLGPVDLTGATSPAISFNTLFQFTSPAPELFLKVSTDYAGTGDPSAATWTTVDFPRATTALTRTPTGDVPLPSFVANRSDVYVAFHYVAGGTVNLTTSQWQIDDVVIENVEVLSLNLTVPASMNEGTGGALFNGSVSIPVAQAGPVSVTVTSTDPTEILLDNGALPFRDSVVVTIPAGQTTAQFYVQAQRDRVFDGNQSVRLTASIDSGSPGFGEILDAEAFIQVVDLDVAPAPLTEFGYTQDFATFAAATPALPLGWNAVGPVTSFQTDAAQVVWGEGFNSGYRGGASVFGFQHTGSTGVLVQSVTLENVTTETINDLTVSYLGRVARADQGRSPAYVVAIDSASGTQTVAALAYSTADGDSIRRQASLTGLNLAPGATFTITWTSDTNATGSDSRKQIGISDVSVTLGVQTTVPTVSGLVVDPAQITRTSAEVAATVTSAGGLTLTASGFVYIPTASLVGELTLATAGAIDVPQLFPAEAEFVASLAGLDPGTSYTIRAYATNALGTSYTAAQTFRSINPAASLAGVYEQPFDGFTGTLPVGWSALGTGNLLSYLGTWGGGSAAGFYGGVSDPGVLGYQHTSVSGILTVTLSLVNDTGYTINSLDVGYMGRVENAGQALTPQWAVSVNGTPVTDLGYSTANDSVTGLAADRAVSATLSGLSIAPGAEITIRWESTRGGDSGSARQIGIGEVVVTAGVEATAAPVVALADPTTSLVTSSGARLHGSVTATNGSITAHGFVYALTSQNADPSLGGENVSFIELAGGGLQAFAFAANATNLLPGAEYSFKAYATNSLGTGYSAVGTWTTASAAIAPSVSSPTSSAVTATNATLGGTVMSDGGAAITSYGVVIGVQSVNPAPSLGDPGVIVVSLDEAVSGAFTLPAAGLTAATTYAFRAFATNSAGTSYSEAGSFATPALPTTLAVGDLSIIGFNANAPDGFAFVTWVDLAPNTQIKFTDNGFLSAGAAGDAGNGRGTEGFVTWTNTSAGTVAAGTVITIVDAQSSPAGATASVGSTTQLLNGLSTSGDQIFAYQGAGAGTSTTTSDFGNNANPTTFTGSLVFGLTYGADWLTSGTTSTNLSYLPAELAGASANVALAVASVTRGQYTGARSGFESVAAAKAAVTNPANWTTAIGAGAITLDATPFFLGEVVATTTTLGSVTPLTVDFGQAVSFVGTVSAASGSDSPTGTVQIRTGGPTGTLLASTSVAAGSGGSGSFSITTTAIPVGTYADIQAFYLPTGGFGASSSTAFASTLTIVSTATATSMTLDSITPLASVVGTTITFSGTVAAGAGTTTPAGTIQIRSGGPTGTLVASTSTITGTGGTGSYSIEVSNLPVGVYGTLQAFFVANVLFDASQSDYFLNAVTVRPTGVTPQFVRWTFEGDSLLPVVGSGTASAIGGVTPTFSTGTGSGRGWNTAAYPAQGTASGTAGVQFMVSTVGRESISLSFDHRASSTASRWAQVDYTLDGGATWVTGHWTNAGGLSPDSTFATYGVDFSGVTGANNNANFGVRIVSIFQPTTSAYQAAGGASTYGTGGSWRFDNVTFGGFAGPAISTSTGADYLRFVTYNIATAQDTGAPRSGLDTILQAIGTETVAGWSGSIDLLALQEVQSQNATTQLVVDSLNGVYGSGSYARGSVNAYSAGGGTLGVVYNTASLNLVEEVSITTGGPRNAMRYLFRPLAATLAETFYVYVAHFKSGTDSASVSSRAAEAAALRADADRLGAGASVLYVGDFNVYQSSEVAYQALIGSGGPGRAFDPINRPGNWSDGSSFRDIFTQAPAIDPAGGLIGGGLDDRFDFQLVSDAVLTGNGLRYQSGSYRTFGNNGTVPVSGAINDPANTALPDLANRTTVLNLLTTVSDHLPVVADYTVPAGAPLSALSTAAGTASSAASFNVRGSSLTGNLQVTPPAGFEVSTSAGSGYSSGPLALTAAAGVVNATVYIRLAAGTAAGTYGGVIQIAGGGAATSTLAMPTSTVTDPAPATITVTSVEAYGGAGLDWALFDATGSAGTGWDFLSGSGTLTLVDATAQNPFVVYPVTLSSISPVTRGDAANFDATQNYSWRLGTFAGGIVGFTPGSIVVDTTDFTNNFDALRGSFSVRQSGTSLFVDYTYSAATPAIGTSGSLSGVSTTYGTASGTTTITVTGSNLTGAITATAPTGFEVSSDGSSFGSTATFTPSSGSVSGTLYARLAATTNAGTYSDDVSFASTGATGVTAAVPSSTVNQKELTITGLSAASRVYDGTTGATLSGTAALFGVIGSDDVSLTGTGVGGFNSKDVNTANAVSVTGFSLLGAKASNYSLTQPSLSASILAKRLTVRADNQTKVVNTANPTLTATIMGFVNGETVATALTGAPALSTTAVQGSLVGSYPITVSAGTLAATGGNYMFSTLVDGTLTVTNPAVKVTGVYVRGSTWNSTYLSVTPTFVTVGTDRLGWQLRDGANQLANSAIVSWSNVNRISVRFDQAISLPQGAALTLKAVTGSGAQTITPTAVSLLAGGTVAQFSVSALATGKYVLSIPATGITDAAGTTVLDGEWTTSSSTFAQGSGNGTAGGVFNFAFNVLVGDVVANGTVNGSDRSTASGQLFRAFTTSNFRSNVNGDASINGTDLTVISGQLFRGLGALTAPTAPTASLASIGSPTFASVTATAARLGATVTSSGGEPVLERGVVLVAGTTGTPAVGDAGAITLLSAGGVGTFTVDFAGLGPSTAYRFRGFVRTSLGTVYTDVGSFTTSSV
jgi:endonuclease/exonuclease/phosphatase family metal-dependent hydrolase